VQQLVHHLRCDTTANLLGLHFDVL
jgi:hypothetical protein